MWFGGYECNPQSCPPAWTCHPVPDPGSTTQQAVHAQRKHTKPIAVPISSVGTYGWRALVQLLDHAVAAPIPLA